jgi:hypothetical protein
MTSISGACRAKDLIKHMEFAFEARFWGELFRQYMALYEGRGLHGWSEYYYQFQHGNHGES